MSIWRVTLILLTIAIFAKTSAIAGEMGQQLRLEKKDSSLERDLQETFEWLKEKINSSELPRPQGGASLKN